MGKLLSLRKKETAKPANLEGMLAECLDYGRPMLFCHDDMTWACKINLNTTSFVKGEAHSGHDHESPASAVGALLNKLRQLPK